MTDNSTPRLRRSLIRIAQTTILAYAVMLVCLVAMETRLLFPGAYSDRPIPHGDISRHGDVPDEDMIHTVHVESLPCRLLECPEPQNHVLFFHGNGIRASDLDHWTRRLSGALHATVLTAEFRGFTDDQTPSEAGLIEDSRLVHDYFCARYELTPSDVVLYGRSLGGGCAAAIAAQRNAKVLVLDRTFDAAWRVAAERFPLFPIRLLMRNRFDSAQQLANFKGPLVQIHGRPDTIIPIRRGRALFQAVSAPDKVWLEVPNLHHNDSLSDDWLQRLAEAIRKASG